jgi:hypothetical protein
MSNKQIACALIAIAVLSLLAACGPATTPAPTAEPPSDTVTFREGFEEGLDAWQQGSDVPEDPYQPGEPVFWTIETSPDQAASGAWSARLTIDGKQDDGTIWLMRACDVAAEGTLSVQVAFDLWSASESFNTLAQVAAYAGPQPPTAEGDFDTRQAANLVEGWRTYAYTFQVPGDAGEVWVAVGISAVWETEMTYFIDEVGVEIAPAEEAGAPQGGIAVEGVQVTDDAVVVRGTSTLPEGTCVNTELWADGLLQTWWPSDACAPVQNGTWELMVPLDPGQRLEPGVQYMVRAYQPGGPNVVSTFPFDLGGPPTPPSEPPAEDPTLLLPESAEPLHRASADLDGNGAPEEIVLTGWGGGPDQLGYDFLQMFVVASDGGEVAIAWQSEGASQRGSESAIQRVSDRASQR